MEDERKRLITDKERIEMTGSGEAFKAATAKAHHKKEMDDRMKRINKELTGK